MAGSSTRQSRSGKRSGGAPRSSASKAARRQKGSSQLGMWAWLGGGILVAVIAGVIGISIASSPSTPSTPATGGAGTVVQGNGGTWTDITANTLAAKMTTKTTNKFTLLNVKTPYIGEIQGTDLYIPYTDLAARASELPTDKTAPIVVYCRSGNESAIASQTLLDLGYTNIENLDGGMEAWTASGRSLVQVARS
jgi:rhodanese-related sulfurtransferase